MNGIVTYCKYILIKNFKIAEKRTIKGHWETLWDNQYVNYAECGASFMDVYKR